MRLPIEADFDRQTAWNVTVDIAAIMFAMSCRRLAQQYGVWRRRDER